MRGLEADGRTRTDDLLITNQLLYQLSYASEQPNLTRTRTIFQRYRIVRSSVAQRE